MKPPVNDVAVICIGGVYEYQGGATTLYYEGNALRRTGYASDNGVFYLLQASSLQAPFMERRFVAR